MDMTVYSVMRDYLRHIWTRSQDGSYSWGAFEDAFSFGFVLDNYKSIQNKLTCIHYLFHTEVYITSPLATSWSVGKELIAQH